jgi:hypothetical protein
MKEGKYGYHSVWNIPVNSFFKKLDVTKLKEIADGTNMD